MRVLDALAQEAIDASDEDIAEAAADLRMDLDRQGSSAFAGLTYFARPQLLDFFDVEMLKRAQALPEPIAEPAQKKGVRQRRGRAKISVEGKPPHRK
jgi:hypothetical protein